MALAVVLAADPEPIAIGGETFHLEYDARRFWPLLRVAASANILFYRCPRSESNQHLMITNQLHDLHATGATLGAAGL